MGMTNSGLASKNFMTKYFIGFLLGTISGIYILNSIQPNSENGSALVISPFVSTNGNVGIGTPTPSPFDFWQKIISEASLSTVAIESFQNGRIQKRASGIILSSDGLIVTTLDVSAGSFVQVLYEDKILKGSLVYKDNSAGLLLIKAVGANFNVSNIDKVNSYEPGQEYMLTGRLANLSKPVIFSQKATVKYILDSRISLDTNLDKILNGAKAINHRGQMAGITRVVGEDVYLIKSETIDDFYKKFINK